MTPGNPSPQVLVWDLPLRLFHWLLVINLVFLVVTGNIGGDWVIWHIRAAYIMSGLLLFRIMWGGWGSHHARFGRFVVSPSLSVKYLASMFQGKTKTYYGHNPAGAFMVVIMLFALLVQFVAGTVITDEIMWFGPFYNWVSESLASLGTRIHYQMELVLIVLASVHVLAVLYHQLVLKEKIIEAMIHGKKTMSNKMAESVTVNYLALVIIVILCASWVGWLWSLPI